MPHQKPPSEITKQKASKTAFDLLLYSAFEKEEEAGKEEEEKEEEE